MQTTCCVNQYNISTISLRTREGVESHTSRITTHLLLYHRHAYTLTPDAELFYSCSTESIGSTQINLLTCLLELPSQFSDSRGFADAIDANHQDHIRFMITRKIPVIVIFSIILSQEIGNLITEDTIQFRSAHILIASHTLFDTFNNLQRGIYTHITGNQHLLKIIQHIIINL